MCLDVFLHGCICVLCDDHGWNSGLSTAHPTIQPGLGRSTELALHLLMEEYLTNIQL